MDLTEAFVGLDDRERLFVESKLRGMTTRAAAAAAGMSEAQAGALSQRDDVKRALDTGRRLSIEATGIDRSKISDMLMDAYRAAENASEMVMAARELGKLHGVYAAQKVEHSHQVTKVTKVEQLRQLSNDDLERVARGELVLEGEFTEILEPKQLSHGS